MATKKWQSVLLKDKTFDELKNLEIEFWWVDLETHDQKVSHLIWFYKHYKNNNSSNIQS